MKTVLVVSSDAGGTVALLPVVHEMLARRLMVHIVASGPAIRIWQRGKVSCSRDLLPDTISELEAMSHIERHSTGAILSGAGRNNRIEHTFRKAAARLGVFCFALVDGWFNFSSRFQRDADGVVTFSVPDRIGVMDEASVAEMLEEGFDSNKILIVGAPHVEETVQFVTSVSEVDSNRLCARFGLQENVRTFVFFSTPLVSEDRQDAGGMPDYGYTQVSVLREVVQALSDACEGCLKPVQLVVKPHPSESSGALSRVLQEAKRSRLLHCQIIEECKSKELICLADAVMGITSTALLEAARSGKPALSIQVGRDLSTYPDKYFENHAGIAAIYDSAHCRREIWQLLCTPRQPRGHSVSSGRNQAASKVVDVLLEHLAVEPMGNRPA